MMRRHNLWLSVSAAILQLRFSTHHFPPFVNGRSLLYTTQASSTFFPRKMVCLGRTCRPNTGPRLASGVADYTTILETPMSSNTYTESWLTGPQSTKFYTRTYAPASSPRAVIVFIHGFAEHIGRYTHFHPLFAERGIAIFTFDQRGFGRTAQDVEEKSKNSAYGKTSWQDQMGDIAWALAHAKKEFPGLPVFLMGHSMVSRSGI